MRRTALCLAVAVLAVSPATPAAADVAWPDGLGPDTFHIATVGAASITTGKNHSCAITSLGLVYCWGDNADGQLGDGNMPQGSATAQPVSRTGDLTHIAVQVDAGDDHTCAIDFDGYAYCWGANADGQLGDASTTTRTVPTEVDMDVLGQHSFVEISTGANHTCGVDDQGVAWCWGDDSAGQLGVAGQPSGTTVPTQVSTSTGMTAAVVDIAAGGDTTCATTEDGAAWCWGAGASGQLGDGSSTDRSEPVAVSTAGPLNGANVQQITVGETMACAVDVDGAASCWGDTASGLSATPARVNAPGVHFVQLAAAPEHVCGLDDGNVAYCWGGGADGQLGDGSLIHEDDPVRVSAGARDVDTPLRDLDAGGQDSCALDRSGRAYCWGATAGNSVPVLVQGLPRPATAVTRVRVSALDGGLRASWRPSADFGTGTFISYLAVTTFSEASCEVDVATGTHCDLHGLVNGKSYDVTVLTYTTDGVTLSAFGSAAPRKAPPRTRPPTRAPSSPPAILPITGDGPSSSLAGAGLLLIATGAAALVVRRRPVQRRGTVRRPS